MLTKQYDSLFHMAGDSVSYIIRFAATPLEKVKSFVTINRLVLYNLILELLIKHSKSQCELSLHITPTQFLSLRQIAVIFPIQLVVQSLFKYSITLLNHFYLFFDKAY